MSMKQLIVVWMSASVIIGLSGCATTQSQTQTMKTNSGKVHVSGDVTMTAISR